LEVIIGATNKILAKRVDELTEALADVRENAKEVSDWAAAGFKDTELGV